MNMLKPASPEIDGAALGVLTEHRKGEALNDISQALREVAGAVVLTGKPGSVTIKLKIRLNSGTSGTLTVSDEIKSTIPKADNQGSTFYADHNNNLVRSDPSQLEMASVVVDVERARQKPAPAVDLAQE